MSVDPIIHKLEEVFDHRQAKVLAEVILESYNKLAKVSDFSELKGIVGELAQAQQRTEMRVEELAQAQQRTEMRVEELAQAQQRTEMRVEELAQAQTRTEKALFKLQKQVGGLSESIGGDIEDIAATVVHEALNRWYGWTIDILERGWVKLNSRPVEIDFTGTAHDPARPQTTIRIIGEAKHNITRREVEKFLRKIEKAKKVFSAELFPVIFCYRIHPDARELIKEEGLALVTSRGDVFWK